MEDARRALVPLACGAAGCLLSLYALGAYAAFRSTADARAPPAPGSAPRPRRRAPHHPPGSAPRPGAAAAGGGAPRSTAASGTGAPGPGASVYESARAVDEYLLMHYGPPGLVMPHEFGPRSALGFPARCAALCAAHCPPASRRSALDVGCAVGGASFELARSFGAVTGVDFSDAFVSAATRLARGERLPATAREEGDLSTWFVAAAPVDAEARGRVAFAQGDACAPLPPPLAGPYDAVLAANLLCRLPNPDAFLAQLPALVAPGGVAVLVSPFSWLQEYTPKDRWLGGTVVGGEAVDSAQALGARMRKLGFGLVEAREEAFLIREHARKYQYGVSNATVWRREG